MKSQRNPLIGEFTDRVERPADSEMTGRTRWVLATILLVGMASVTQADELITMSNGMTCWRDATGHTYGCSGGVNTGDSGFNDTRTGQRYERISPNQAIDTGSGQPIQLPPGNRSRTFQGQEEW